ncbi:MAG: hypothetical protein ACP5QO_10580 [Clostridia bacterium]
MDPILKRIATAMTVVMLVTLALIFTLSGTHVAAGTGGNAPAPRLTAATTAAKVVNVKLFINVNGPHGWPTYTLSKLNIPDNSIVHLTIINNDNGGGTLAGPFGHAEGIIGLERVNGKATVVSSSNIAHTFTVPALGLNIVIPASPNNGVVTVQATFKVTKAGNYRWQCMAPCGTGSTGWGGPMATVGYMTGLFNVEN